MTSRERFSRNLRPLLTSSIRGDGNIEESGSYTIRYAIQRSSFTLLWGLLIPVGRLPLGNPEKLLGNARLYEASAFSPDSAEACNMIDDNQSRGVA
jgi:hypothetical protein